MKSILRKNQQGIAMLIAIMVLSLGGSIALISFRSSTQELGVSRFTEHEMYSQYLVESGVDQVVSWVMDPESFPDTYPDFNLVRTFFADLPTTQCVNGSDSPDLTISDASFLANPNGPFSELNMMGEIEEIRLYAPVQLGLPEVDRRRCTLEVTAISGSGAKKKIKVDLSRNPIGPITAGVQGVVSGGDELPIWTHWGEIHYAAVQDGGITPDANLGANILRVPKEVADFPVNYGGTDYGSDPEDPVLAIFVEADIGSPVQDNPGDLSPFDDRPNVRQQQPDASLDEVNPSDPDQVDLRRFLRANGEVYTVSSEAGKLEKNGVDVGTFDELFEVSEEENPAFRLVWIVRTEQSSVTPLLIKGAQYKGYFFISGSVIIEGGKVAQGREITDVEPTPGVSVDLSGINLEGLFYTSGLMEFHYPFSAYGALFSRGGFTGSGAQDLEVWYNKTFETAVFPGVRPVTPQSGTWATLASGDS